MRESSIRYVERATRRRRWTPVRIIGWLVMLLSVAAWAVVILYGR